jgi:vitamin B12 transporter
LELAAQTDPTAVVQFKGSFTRLEAEDETAQTPLLRRPHYLGSVDFWARLGASVTLGVGGTWVGIRPDVDALTYATVNDPGFDVARVYAAWQVSKNFAFKARVENALDRRYEPVNGYPALPRGIFGGAEWSF